MILDAVHAVSWRDATSLAGHHAAQDTSHLGTAEGCPPSRAMPPPPPPPPPGAGPAPPPPPPPGGLGANRGFKIVPGLGDALHDAMKKISGVEEIAPAAEGAYILASP